MRKYLIISLAALAALASCSKQSEMDRQGEIGFNVVNFATKANVAFTNEDFGTYAWHHAEDGAVTPFMENEQVGKKGSEWKPLSRTYYWPKSGYINFVSYSPYIADASKVSVAEESIKITGYVVKDEDLMYADRATNQTENITPGTYHDVSGANGVPTLFRHALAKLSFQVEASFLEHTAEDGSVTTWTVTLDEATLSGIYNTGDLSLDADGDKWTTDGWKADTGKSADPTKLVTGDPMELSTKPQPLYDGKSFYVLPQDLAADAQKITLVFHVVTKLPNGGILEEDIAQTFDLTDLSTLQTWGMNQNIVYTIDIRPTKAINPEDHPHDPDDAIITYDPAEVDWVEVKNATIQV